MSYEGLVKQIGSDVSAKGKEYDFVVVCCNGVNKKFMTFNGALDRAEVKAGDYIEIEPWSVNPKCIETVRVITTKTPDAKPATGGVNEEDVRTRTIREQVYLKAAAAVFEGAARKALEGIDADKELAFVAQQLISFRNRLLIMDGFEPVMDKTDPYVGVDPNDAVVRE